MKYLEDRYSRFLRIVCSVINIIYGIFFMSLVVYAPALALKLVTGIDHRIMVAVIFLVCIFYSSIGGFKAVLWTDSLQAVIMVVSTAIVVIVGTSKLGGVSEVWKMADSTNRLNFFNFDVDPRTRHTFWTAVVGGYFQWLPMYANQAQIQRYVSLPNYRSVYIALGINLLGLFVLMGMTYFCGLVIFATYFTCDPILTKDIAAADQILPLFVAQTLEEYPGLPGLFVAGITCAALSTVSSGVNALAASVVEDYVKKWRPTWNDTKLAWVSKGIATATGFLSFGFVFIAEQMGNIFTAATSLFGIFGGPTFGVFICGMFFPWTNNLGVSLALLISVAFMSFLGVGQTVYNNRGDLPLQFKDLDMSCPADPNNGTFAGFIEREYDWKNKDWDALTQIFSISPLWYPCYGIISSVVLGLIFSFIFHKPSKVRPMESRLFIPIVLKLWKKICPGKLVGFVKFTKEELLENPELGGSSNSNEGFDGSYSPKKQSVISAPHLINDHVNNNGKNEG
ncbi:sodium-coupled monocarboxylate transporter 2 isoform X2 [Folsomia candida]|uniref:sodium-coupled monocarboxylate transporter 2 isoform X2 n=1 Tax=Folsomia candida TaxID=158441 RepID=UPI001604D8CD|nr:sodium-coupled monocarboxylate transporter 2 isoform X2 [Folsomia candida]